MRERQRALSRLVGQTVRTYSRHICLNNKLLQISFLAHMYISMSYILCNFIVRKYI